MDVESVILDLTLSPEQAEKGVKKMLSRNGKKLEVSIPPNTRDGNTVKLTGALDITDGRPGDILIMVRVVKSSTTEGVIAVTDRTFQGEVLESRLPVLVDFWAAWCGPCRMVAPVVDRLADRFQGKMKFCKLNVDENPQTAARFQVMSIPTLLFFKNGQVVDKMVGAQPEPALFMHIENVLK